MLNQIIQHVDILLNLLTICSTAMADYKKASKYKIAVIKTNRTIRSSVNKMDLVKAGAV